MQIKGSVVIVTGATGGLGRTIACALGREGANVVLAARRVNILEEVAQQVDPTLQHVLVVPTNLQVKEDIEHLVSATVERFGRVDVLVNVAGINSPRSILKTQQRSLQRILEINLLAPTLLIQSVVPHMQRQKSGIIINMGSISGEIATLGFYSAAKFGLRGLNDAIRRELKADKIKVVLLEPGFIQTRMTARLTIRMPMPDIVAKAVVSAIRRPRRRIIVPWFYRILVFLAQHFPLNADKVILHRWFQGMYGRERGKNAAESTPLSQVGEKGDNGS